MRAHLAQDLPKGLIHLVLMALKGPNAADLPRTIKHILDLVYFGGELMRDLLILLFELRAKRKTLLFRYCYFPLFLCQILSEHFGIERIEFMIVDEPISILDDFRNEML